MADFQTLVIAYGNCLRGDDGVGPAMGEIIKSWQIPGVKVLIERQLIPELIAEMKQAESILFIDAGLNLGDRALVCRPLSRQGSIGNWGHHLDPEALLKLLHDLESRTPSAWQLTISAFSFDHGEQLTPSASANLQVTVPWVRKWLKEMTCST
jgi:hydrogenase maturation protease